MPKAKHPMQPIVEVDGVVRFKQNAIVRFLVDWCAAHNGHLGAPKVPTPGGVAPDLNCLSMLPFSDEDYTQFIQLIGYSVSGAGDLGGFNRRVLAEADALVEELLKKKKGRK